MDGILGKFLIRRVNFDKDMNSVGSFGQIL
jgi:hypothetical protein